MTPEQQNSAGAPPLKVRKELALMVLREAAKAEKRSIDDLASLDEVALEARLEEFLKTRVEHYRMVEETRAELDTLMERLKQRQENLEQRTAEMRLQLEQAHLLERPPKEPKKGRRRIFGKSGGKTLL